MRTDPSGTGNAPRAGSGESAGCGTDEAEGSGAGEADGAGDGEGSGTRAAVWYRGARVGGFVVQAFAALDRRPFFPAGSG